MLKLNWENCIQEDRNELVFANRNKEYGAYYIRSRYTKTLLMAFLASTFAASFA